jgi:hypothetical protein
MKPATLHGLVRLLRQLLDDLAAAETPAPSAAPPCQTQGDHQPYIRADMSPCCARHDDDFTARNRRINRFVIDLARAPEPGPGVSPQARDHIQERLCDRRA